MKKLGPRVLAAYIPGRGSVDSDDPGGDVEMSVPFNLWQSEMSDCQSAEYVRM